MTSSLSSSSRGRGRDLHEFLIEAELEHYYDKFSNDLKICSLSQMKYVVEDDLTDMRMTKPEQRRFKKYFKKHYPQGLSGKLKKLISRTNSDVPRSPDSSDSGSPGRRDSSSSGMRSPGRHIISYDSLQIQKTLDTGEFGLVHQGIWTSHDRERVQVAIKCLARENLHQGVSIFLKEVAIMHSLEHENIVQFYGVVLDKDKEPSLMLVTELAPLRSLLECLKEPTLRVSFPVPVLCDFTLQIANGMAYLENNQLTHHDLAARNILVFAKNKVKISDFGISRALGVGQDYYQKKYNLNLKLPVAWCAPECINNLKFTSASDVWAYGVTLWEMFSYGLQPWVDLLGDQNVGLHVSNGDSDLEHQAHQISQTILEAVDEPNCQRLEKPDCCPKDFYSLMLKCWEHNSEKRPKFIEIVGQLPMIKPVQVQAQSIADLLVMSPTNPHRKDMLIYKNSDIITVLDNKPHNAQDWKHWKGVLNTGKTGFFDPNDTRPYIETKVALPPRSNKIARKVSLRSKSSKPAKLSREMISRPQNDLRHTGHIGYDGAVFGDVSFIGNNYDKLPIKVVTPYEPHKDLGHTVNESPLLKKTSLTGQSSDQSDSQWTISSVNSDSSDFFNDTAICARQNGGNLDMKDSRQDKEDGYIEIVEDLEDFKFPDISLSTSMDFGTSFIDDMMKAFNEKKEEQLKSSESETRSSSEREGRSSSERETTPSSEQPHVLDGGKSLSSKSEKRKSKLRLMIAKDEKEEKKMAKVKPMSASEERKLDDAIAMATSLAAKSLEDDPYTPKTPKTPKVSEGDFDNESGTESPSKSKSRFSFKFPSKKSPKAERRNFSEEIEKVPNVCEDMSPEAQDAYNMLVVKGTINDDPRDSGSLSSVSGHGSPTSGHTSPRIQSTTQGKRERRMRRSLEHQTSIHRRESVNEQTEGKGCSSTIGAADTQHMTHSMKEPAGIPAKPVNTGSVGVTSGSVNPLRMLRSNGAIVTRMPPRVQARPSRTPNIVSDRMGGGLRFPVRSQTVNNSDSDVVSHSYSSRSVTTSRTSSLSHPEPYTMSRSKASSDSVDSYSGRSYSTTETGHGDELVNPLPLPPKPSKPPSQLYQRHRQRKYPLVINESNGHHDGPENLPPAPPVPMERVVAPMARAEDDHDEEVDNMLSNTSSDDRSMSSSPKTLVPKPHVAMKLVKCNAEQMGIYNSDRFWTQQVDFEETGTSRHSPQPKPIPGSYKTADSVSYEDLLDFALTDDKKDYGEKNCKEVEEMQKILSKQVPATMCMDALNETQWNVPNAIKFVKMKQLLSTQLADIEQCKECLMACNWDVHYAADRLLSYSSQGHQGQGQGQGQGHQRRSPSPDCIEL